jgi:hypothetical protein
LATGGRGQKGGLSAYAEQVGKHLGNLTTYRNAAEVAQTLLSLEGFLDKAAHLAAIHKLPRAAQSVSPQKFDNTRSSMETHFYSFRALAQKVNLPVSQIAATANLLGLGKPAGPHGNSPVTLSGEEANKILHHICKQMREQIEDAKSRIKRADLVRAAAEKQANDYLTAIRSTARLASFARAQGHPAAQELEHLKDVIDAYDRKAGIPTTGKRTGAQCRVDFDLLGRFHHSIESAMKAVSAKL